MDQECREVIEERNILRMKYLERPIRIKRTTYKAARRVANKIIRNKRMYLNAILTKAEQDFKKNNSRESYKDINFFRKGYSPRTMICKNREGEILTERKILDRWKHYFDRLLNVDTDSRLPKTSVRRKETRRRCLFRPYGRSTKLSESLKIIKSQELTTYLRNSSSMEEWRL